MNHAAGGVPVTPELLLFGAVAGAAALCAVGVVAFNNAIRSALCLVVNFFLLAFLYFTLNAEMLGITQIVVYTGAIMVLFLFVIMLLNLGAPNLLVEKRDPKKYLGILLGCGMFVLLGSQVLPELIKVHAAPLTPELAKFGGPEAIGRTLFTSYMYPFEAVSVLLLIGIVGSILLAKRRI
ncbi:MAG: NADH-quinone oxidoreductase subunit J [Fimbriimonas sp.]|nr:NADH-quinone oxidoreductase subunit J [Fimbriimonas sp.]